MKVLITGGRGYIASRLYEHVSKSHEVTKIDRSDFDLTNYEETKKFFENKHYDIVIHCAIGGGHRLVKDSIQVLDDNLKMYYNLLSNRSCYERFITVGSGAEIYADNEPYGMSKKIISASILEKNNFYNLRVYGIFDENELDTRFIKSNILRYIKGESMEVYQNKLMDFFYMEDFYKVIDYYIKENSDILHKEFECSYYSSLSYLSYSLIDIAKFINNLEDKKVEIKIINENPGTDYIAKNKTIVPIEFVGLKEGIKTVYNKLKWKI